MYITYYISSYMSDHSPVLLNLKSNNFKHSKGLWKFNYSLLKQQEYLNTIKEMIKNQEAVGIDNI